MPILEERMIYRVGKSSLAIIRPQNWLKYIGLTAGDSIQVTGNGDLRIRPIKKKGMIKRKAAKLYRPSTEVQVRVDNNINRDSN